MFSSREKKSKKENKWVSEKKDKDVVYVFHGSEANVFSWKWIHYEKAEKE